MFTLLVVDDHVSDADLLKDLLKHLHRPYKVYFATDRDDALDFLHLRGPYEDAQRPNLILCDLNMAKGNGLDVLECLKTEPELNGIPVIVLSGSKIRKAYKAKSNGFARNPLDQDHASRLIHAIETFWMDVADLASFDAPPNIHRASFRF